MHAGGVDGLPRGEVVAAVQHDVGASHQPGQQAGIDAQRHGVDHDVGVDRRNGRLCRRGLGLADAVGGVGDLALQVGQVHVVVIDQRDAAHAGTGQIQRHGRAQAAGADDQRMGGQQPFLAFDA